jgi:hypothetical protein
MILYIEKEQDDYYHIYIKADIEVNNRSIRLLRKTILDSDIEITNGFKKFILDKDKLNKAIKLTLNFVKEGTTNNFKEEI